MPCWMLPVTRPWFPEPDQYRHVKTAPPLKEFLPAILWFVVVLVLLCVPGKDMPESRFPLPNADKLVHCFMFGLMAFLFCRPFLVSDFPTSSRKKIIFLFIALAVSLWGLATEFIQKYLVLNRDFELLDWLADSLGALGVYLIIPKNR